MPPARPTKEATSKKTPKGWPASLTYLEKPVYSKFVTPDMRKELQNPSSPDPVIIKQTKAGPTALVQISPISDPAHPAKGQHGLLAAQHLPPDSFILFYLGHVHAKEDADSESDYDLSLDRELGIGVDATMMGNEARFINDYRGIASRPNAEFRNVWADSGGMLEKRMAVFVFSAGKSGKRSKGVAKGEEILVSYGKGFWTERQKEGEQSTTIAAAPGPSNIGVT
ncbi:hypothetical protein K402DRAFT_413086 [Aulographum hederae CBS 113979]|uniref:SET domain-containing protein n=1 Tax=Aulographum hederae CBS 113979 TaxID=1176131 RepID=A0A6G1GYB1_9PEZI|nr:hypothetical protein K402DRAFT_413086 [Aulographum hederae CBS 113979]